jgi:hypothetical protein
MKKLSSKQMEKGLRHLENASNALHRELKNLIEFKRFCEDKYFIGGTDKTTINKIKSDIIEARIRLSNLQRKYL